MNVLIVGYTGFIGRNLIDYYLKINKINLFLISRKIKKNFKNIHRIKYIKSNSINLKNFFQNKKNKIDVIIFCASVVDSKKHTYKTYYNGNIIYLKKFLKLIDNKNIKNFIYLSSINIYGKKINNYNEEHETKPQDFYAKTKLLAEKIIQQNFKKKKNYLILRLPLVYGKINLKGSLSLIKKLIQIFPFFFTIKFKNKKSMLGVKNLANFIYYYVKKNIQNKFNYRILNIKDKNNYSTDDIFFMFSKIYNKFFFRIYFLDIFFRPLINFFSKKLFEKYFGSYTIDSSKIKKIGWKQKYNFINHFNN